MAILKSILLTTSACLLVGTSSAQLTKSQQTSVVLLKSPGICSGSGFFVGSQTIVTASHVAQTVRMEVYISGKRYYATVQKRNDAIDYAELRISGYSCPNPLKTTANMTPNERLYTYGYPKSGILEGSNGQLGFKCGFWYLNGVGEQGLSGGPVVNSRGYVVGTVTNQHYDGGTLFRSISETKNACKTGFYKQ
jgi:hypothetical protein